ncbi:LLM class flavin-dependent oxidoreductase [Myxococcota bacterium]|nr:LLM class flavin-dependent oxidoreductase [Myxococcota bacterium]
MKFGISVGNGGSFGSPDGVHACLDLARRADELGFDSVWVNDHLVLPETIRTRYPYGDAFAIPSGVDFHEPLVLVNALAAVTQRVEVGTGVLVIPHRHPAITAKMLAFADRLSGGRVVLGVGVGWLRDEFEALGLPDEHFDRRGEVTDEYLCAIKEMWTNTGPSSYRGDFVEFSNVGTFPKPARKPHPPIVIGGKSQRALRRASLLGNGFQALFSSPDDLAQQVTALQEICRQDRRDPSELEIQLAQPMQIYPRALPTENRPPLCGSLDQIALDLQAYARAGLQHLVSTPSTEGDGPPFERAMAGLETLAREMLPAFGNTGARP